MFDGDGVALRTRALPLWNDLCHAMIAECRREPGDHTNLLTFLEPGQRLRQKRMLDALAVFGRMAPPSSYIHRLCTGDWHKICLFVLDQVFANETASQDEERSPHWRYQPHHQLSCTRRTLERRVGIVSQHVGIDAPILVIGDDDMQGVGLARKGFKDLTVIEIDPKLSGEIERVAQAESLPIRVVRQSIESVDVATQRDYAAVLMDPPCNYDGFKMFLDGALRLTKSSAPPLVFLNTHFMSYQQDGYTRARQALIDAGLGLVEHHPRLNRYPHPWVARVSFNMFLRKLEPTIRSRPLQYFVSDLFVLQAT